MAKDAVKKKGTIKDRISGSGKVRKKIVIKKKTAKKSKNIADHFSAGKEVGAGKTKKTAPSKSSVTDVKRPGSTTKLIKQTAFQKETEIVSGKKSTSKTTPDSTPKKGVTIAAKISDRLSRSQGTPGKTETPQGEIPAPTPPWAAQGGRKQHFVKKHGPASPGGGRGWGKSQEKVRAQRFFNRTERKKKEPTEKGTTVPGSIKIMESIQVGELAKKLNLRPSEIIAKLMKIGEMVTINKMIGSEVATKVAQEYGCEVNVTSLFDETVIDEAEDLQEDKKQRPPVVTIMGHVDHGKTKLLDTIRKTRVADTEFGAITQHIGAYQVELKRGSITFLDTPGHEAFTAMRARGAAVTDIVVLVVAADDGVMGQTIEALDHAKEANVPIIVAVNKIDLEAANPGRVRQELSQYSLIPEELGGSTIFCEISAKEGTGIDNLLEMILLQAEMLELKANPLGRAIGCVIEARVDPGKGPVATVLVQRGKLKEGDPYVVGIYSGRVRAIFNDKEERIKEAGPSNPIEITGIDGVPQAGDPFHVVENEKYGREIAAKRQHYQQITDAVERSQPTLGNLKNWIQEQEVAELRVIIKADVQGSVEAIRDGFIKLSTEEVRVKVIRGATGAISESDVDLAKASEAVIVGFHVKATSRAQTLASQHRVEIKYYNIIYDALNDVRKAMEGLLEPDLVEKVTGMAEIREIFKISKLGNVAGCMMVSGKINRKNKIRAIRDGTVIHSGDIKSLRRIKEDINEVAEGFECGIAIEGYNDLQVGDQLEGFEVIEVARKLKS